MGKIRGLEGTGKCEATKRLENMRLQGDGKFVAARGWKMRGYKGWESVGLQGVMKKFNCRRMGKCEVSRRCYAVLPF